MKEKKQKKGEKKMAKLIMLSGVPGSGKSTSSHDIAEKEGAKIFSSDEIYVELTGDEQHLENNKGVVFNELYSRVRAHLKTGETAIIDSTNISAKKRVGVLQQFKHATEKEIYQFITPFETCVARDQSRDRHVGRGVIRNMFLRIFVPFEEEGFDKVHYIVDPTYQDMLGTMTKSKFDTLVQTKQTHDELFEQLNMIPYFQHIYNLPQDSKYHAFSVSRHTYYVWLYIHEHYKGEDKFAMLCAALFHDIGKHLAKEFRSDQRYAHFIGHENASAQITFGLLHSLGYELAFVKLVTKLVQLHMRLPREGATEKAFEKFKQSVDEDLYEKLVFFRTADESAK